ncbi:MAG: lytic murein transglycosylase [Rhodobacteraceae bacterium]|jgi:membrane-bound lytic murein transglycosylase B|uniref:Lytic murein transglycosylase n=1 Tax=Salipiger profundus TaxID=1229727 RepID=A0A1U7D344_9RHOB|nr:MULTISPECIES: lytic murein transglycosylase [Salipiger]APX22490.1 lytic murein transglycosylase [Salipiger profundus]MAB06096.1 lytic murein transglycosylase [Paracoccaceae bacterium]GGA11711.1 murein transglycosylase [Salipiger profundus]SFC71250.1 lytic murein transglycosylase [Salipiger profundus]
MRTRILTVMLSLVAAGATAQPTPVAPQESLRPSARPFLSTQGAATAVAPDVLGPAGFRDWVAEFRDRALDQGISTSVFDAAFRGVRYDPAVIKRDRNQNEFTKTVWVYLDSAASDARIAAGRKALEANRALLDRIEAKYGVDKQAVLAIWGLESAYGTFRGSDPVIQSLATLAYDTRRADFFEGQLVDALTILQSGDTSVAHMRGSWAGAMGHTQFMPSSFLELAEDWNGDGKRDIWSDDPADALASAAHYLAENGWTHGQPWGVEVTLPDDFDYTLAAREIEKSAADWAALGVRGTDGAPVADHGPASILLPGGHEGAAFMIFGNFSVIESYNTADAYVIGVGHLGDRIMGAGPIRHGWPREDRALTLPERKELQTRLRSAGFDPEKIDGRIGPLTINAVRDYQQSAGMVPDGYASLLVLDALR